MISALYVDERGCYADCPGVEIWGEARDARLYDGPHAIIAHPPCARWCQFAGFVERMHGYRKGDDGGCFAAAVASVRRWGGVLEHPAHTAAWARFGINTPLRFGGWIRAGIDDPGWTCCVEQGHYGHRARKATWLYAVRCELPGLRWGPGPGEHAVVGGAGYHSAAERQAAKDAGTLRVGGRMGKRARSATPLGFRDVLISMARSVDSGKI